MEDILPKRQRITDNMHLPVHVKPLPRRIDVSEVLKLPTASPESSSNSSHSLGWLNNIERYASVPRRSARDAPVAKFEQHHIAALLQHGVIGPVDPAEVQGHVVVFPVVEAAKQRLRAIMHTKDINEALGADTLRKLQFPSKRDICGFVHRGERCAAFDFSSYYYQFEYSPEISKLMCFKDTEGNYYQQLLLSMGQRQSCEIGDGVTWHLIDFPGRQCHARSVLDNAIFVGPDHDTVLADARTFVDRCAKVGATINEDTSDLPALIVDELDWCGVHLNLRTKQASLMQKAVDKTKLSWSLRKEWTWRQFAAHIGLLFWAWGIIELPMHEFFPTLSFVAHVGRLATEDETMWDRPAKIWPSVWQSLGAWTELVVANKPRTVPKPGPAEWSILTDASAWGWGYVALEESTGNIRTYGAPWSASVRRHYGHLLGRSVFTEPVAVTNMFCHLFAKADAPPARARVGTDNTATRASFARDYNARSFEINRAVARFRAYFPQIDVDFVSVPGLQNLADSFSRGRTRSGAVEMGRKVHDAVTASEELRSELRRLLGSELV